MKPIHALGGALALSLAACVPQPKSSPPVQPRPVATPKPTPAPPPAAVNWMDVPQTPGDWLYRATGGQSRASFGDGETLHFQIICIPGKGITLVRPRTGGDLMRIRTETVERTLQAESRQDAVISTVSANDRLLDAMALSKGRFAVEVAGAPPLYLPSWAEVTRVIEDCR